MTTAFPNKYPGKCIKCNSKIGAGIGICFKPVGGSFACGCKTCFPEMYQSVYAVEIARIEAQRKKAAELEARRLELVAERNALIQKLGLCLDSPFDSKTQQFSYSDLTEWKVPFNGDGTDDEFRKAVQSPAESLYGKLRASGGVGLVSINREEGYVVLSESVQLCD